MVGSMLGGTDESPGTVLTKNGKRFKVYRGMASLAASIGRKSKETGSISLDDDLNDYVAEGVEAMVPYKGTVTDILKQLAGGVRSGFELLWRTYNSTNARKCRIYQNVKS